MPLMETTLIFLCISFLGIPSLYPLLETLPLELANHEVHLLVPLLLVYREILYLVCIYLYFYHPLVVPICM